MKHRSWGFSTKFNGTTSSNGIFFNATANGHQWAKYRVWSDQCPETKWTIEFRIKPEEWRNSFSNNYSVRLNNNHFYLDKECYSEESPYNEIQVINSSGKIVHSEVTNSNSCEIKVYPQEISAGVYFLKLVGSGDTYSKKILIVN